MSSRPAFISFMPMPGKRPSSRSSRASSVVSDATRQLPALPSASDAGSVTSCHSRPGHESGSLHWRDSDSSWHCDSAESSVRSSSPASRDGQSLADMLRRSDSTDSLAVGLSGAVRGDDSDDDLSSLEGDSGSESVVTASSLPQLSLELAMMWNQNETTPKTTTNLPQVLRRAGSYSQRNSRHAAAIAAPAPRHSPAGTEARTARASATSIGERGPSPSSRPRVPHRPPALVTPTKPSAPAPPFSKRRPSRSPRAARLSSGSHTSKRVTTVTYDV